MTWGTRGEAAAIVGKTAQAVSDQREKLARDGMARLKGRRWEYNLEGFREWWLGNVDPRSHSPVGGAPAGRARARELQALIDASPPGAIRPVEESRELREHYEAELARLKAEQLAGALVPIADIEALMFGHIRQARDALMGTSAKVLDQLCALLGNLTAEQRHEVGRLLDRELVKVTEDLSRLPVKGTGASDAR